MAFFGADPLTCAQLFCYSLYKSDTGFSTRVFHGSGVSWVHDEIRKISFEGTHLFLRLLKLWLPLSKVPVTSDIVPILAFVQSLHTAGFSLLSSVALFLIVHSSICRVS